MRKLFKPRNEAFVCEQCSTQVESILYGGSNRNHCPVCLYSKHVDSDMPGDRLSTCGGLMKPISVFTKRTGEYVIVHQCIKCGFIRHNRSASDDDFNLITKLSTIPLKLKK